MKRHGAKKIIVTETLKQDVKQALEPYQVQFAYVFGSAVTGHMHDESDIDIAVFFSDNIPPRQRFKEHLSLHGVLAAAFKVPEESLDISILNTANILLKFVAISEGVVIYEKDHAKRVDFEMAVIRQRDDEQAYRLLSRQVFLQRLAKQSLWPK